MNEVLSRIHQSIDYLRSIGIIHKQQDIADAMGMGKSRISEALRGKEGKFTDHFIDSFADTFSEHIHKEWLLTGEGEMKKNFRLNIPGRLAEQYLKLVGMVVEDNMNRRPHVDAKASAGFIDGLSDGDYGNDTRPLIPGMPDYTFTIIAKGDSMLPRIEDGDTLLCRKLTDRLNPPIGKICVLDTKEGFVVKVIERANEDTITLHSLNPKYRDYDIDQSSILGIAEVVGLVRSFT